MKLNLIDYETSDFGGDDGGGTGVEAGAGPDVTARAVSDPAPAPAWTPDDDPDFDAAVAHRAQLAVEQYLESLQSGTPDVDYDTDVNLYAGDPDMERVLDQLTERVVSRVEQSVQPLRERLEAEQRAENEKRLQDVISDRIAAVDENEGTFTDDDKALVRTLLPSFYQETSQRLGHTDRAVEVAAEKAAKAVKQALVNAEKRGMEKARNRAETLAGVRPEPATGALGIEGAPKPRNLDDVVERWLNRNPSVIR